MLVCENGFLHSVNGNEVEPEKGEMFLLRPGDTHSAVPVSENHLWWDVYIKAENFKYVCGFLQPGLYDSIVQAAELPRIVLPPDFFGDLITRLAAIIRQCISRPTTAQASERVIMCELISRYIVCAEKRPEKYPDCIEKLMQVLQNPNCLPAEVSVVAAATGYSHEYICRCFKKQFGITLQEYLIEKRIAGAANMLLYTDLKVSEISQQLGWKYVTSFINAFKKVNLLTPQEFRRQHRTGKCLSI